MTNFEVYKNENLSFRKVLQFFNEGFRLFIENVTIFINYPK